jgi:hypothetical protein
VDAVEIDPAILKIGKRHPDRPYSDPRVKVVNADARSFLNNCQSSYDLIVFGTLDSMTRLSALSNVRLDNFVYTLESMQAARRCLRPDGSMILYFSVGKSYIEDHFAGILTKSFGQVPVVARGKFGLFTRIYMLGPAFAHLKKQSAAEDKQFMEKQLPGIEVPTDDWPYLYLRSRSINGFYLTLMLVFSLIAAAGILAASAEMRASIKKFKAMDLEMFFFGLAFLLLETKFVTSMNLAWGATWITSAVVFGSILFMVLVATLLTKTKPMPWWFAVVGLFVCLLASILVPTSVLLGFDSGARLLISVVMVGAPIFFASVCFALRFRERQRPDIAFGWNLLGAVAGGLLEFLSMLVGLKALSWIAIAAYLGVVILYSFRVKKRSTAPQPEA